MTHTPTPTPHHEEAHIAEWVGASHAALRLAQEEAIADVPAGTNPPNDRSGHGTTRSVDETDKDGQPPDASTEDSCARKH